MAPHWMEVLSICEKNVPLMLWEWKISKKLQPTGGGGVFERHARGTQYPLSLFFFIFPFFFQWYFFFSCWRGRGYGMLRRKHIKSKFCVLLHLVHLARKGKRIGLLSFCSAFLKGGGGFFSFFLSILPFLLFFFFVFSSFLGIFTMASFHCSSSFQLASAVPPFVLWGLWIIYCRNAFVRTWHVFTVKLLLLSFFFSILLLAPSLLSVAIHVF